MTAGAAWVTLGLSVVCSFIGANDSDAIRGGGLVLAGVVLFAVGVVFTILWASAQDPVFAQVGPRSEDDR